MNTTEVNKTFSLEKHNAPSRLKAEELASMLMEANEVTQKDTFRRVWSNNGDFEIVMQSGGLQTLPLEPTKTVIAMRYTEEPEPVLEFSENIVQNLIRTTMLLAMDALFSSVKSKKKK